MAELWETAKVTPAAASSSSRLLFGYGSLIWKVDFPFVRSFRCNIAGGFMRRFWMKSCDHRGTAEFPGRVVTLVKPEQPAEADVAGVAYEIAEKDMATVLEKLDYRERHGYTRTVGVASDQDGQQHEVQVYFYDAKGAAAPVAASAMILNEPIEETAATIARATGPSGRNMEYLRNLAEAIRGLGMGDDQYLEELLERAEAHYAMLEENQS